MKCLIRSARICSTKQRPHRRKSCSFAGDVHMQMLMHTEGVRRSLLRTLRGVRVCVGRIDSIVGEVAGQSRGNFLSSRGLIALLGGSVIAGSLIASATAGLLVKSTTPYVRLLRVSGGRGS